MSPRRSILAVCALSLVCAATIVVEERRVHTAQERAADLALEKSNAAAAAMPTIELTRAPEFARVLTDGDRLVTRQIVQVRQKADSLDRALQLERRGKYQLATRLDSLQRTILASGSTIEERSSDSSAVSPIRRASFEVRQAPYTVAASVALPAPPDTGSLSIRIALDEIPVTARLSCAPPNANGIRAASIEATSPAWASVRFEQLQQSPDLCASPALQKQRSRMRPAFITGIGRAFNADGDAGWSAFAGVGLAFGG